MTHPSQSNASYQINTVTVYGASSAKLDKIYKDQAYEVGKAIAQQGWVQLNGGAARGLMGAATDGGLDAGGNVDVVVMDIFVGSMHPSVRNIQVYKTMPDRKRGLFEPADAFIALPGGLGTLEEISEIFSWRQLELHAKPIVLLNTNGFYNSLRDFLKTMVDGKFMVEEMLDRNVAFVDTPDQAVAFLKNFSPTAIIEKELLLGELGASEEASK